MIIYGAGLSGLIAAHMLRRFQPTILEAQASLPNNHAALLRFRSDVVSKATGIPFKRVTVDKAIYYQGKFYSEPSIKLNNLYSKKVTGEYSSRSIGNLQSAERFIAPPDFISQMARSCHINYNNSDNLAQLLSTDDTYVPYTSCISTVPMPVMMKMIGYPDQPQFKYRGIWTVNVELKDTELYQTIYFPDSALDYYRASITGNRLIVEYVREPKSLLHIPTIMGCFGIEAYSSVSVSTLVVKYQEYGKILPIADSVRKDFMHHLTSRYSVFSLGRFATWRQILLDDVVQDVNRIESWITAPSAYQRRLEM